MSQKILCVDDDLSILGSFQRQMRGQFQITGALGGEKALRALSEQGPFAVVMSDLHMPGMNGFEFLSRARAISPDSVRVILTGRADLDVAIGAVNAGNIFRFLTKPCAPNVIRGTLSQAIDQHRLILAERELLEKTLRGSVQLLVDILALASPPVFSRSNRIQTYVLHIAAVLDALRWKWQLELSAMLSQIGCITLSETIVSKALAHEALSWDEQAEFASHPATGAKLIGNIPRLEAIAEIIALQQMPFRSFENSPDEEQPPGEDLVAFGAQALRAATDFDRLRSRLKSNKAVVEWMQSHEGEYNPAMVAALSSFESAGAAMRRMQLRAHQLKPKMITLADVHTRDGTLLLARDLEITEALLEVLRRFGQTRGLREPIDVLAPVDREVSLIGSAG